MKSNCLCEESRPVGMTWQSLCGDLPFPEIASLHSQ
jgi:hypothetical protein